MESGVAGMNRVADAPVLIDYTDYMETRLYRKRYQLSYECMQVKYDKLTAFGVPKQENQDRQLYESFWLACLPDNILE